VATTQLDEGTSERVQEVRDRAAIVRRETVRLVGIAKSGHYSSVFSCAEIMGALYSGVMRLAEDPEWPERDRLILVEHGLAGVRMARIGMPADEYSLIGPPTHLYRHYGMDAAGVEAKARELLAA
jgi:Transketolase, thiamine diphosphate binding domain